MSESKRGAGIWISGGTGTRVANCTTQNSVGPGILDQGRRTEMEGNLSEGNGGHGFEFSLGSKLVGNIARGNAGSGFYETTLPHDLAVNIAEAFACGESGRSIWRKFGDRLQAFGQTSEPWVTLAASSLQLRSLLQGLGVQIP